MWPLVLIALGGAFQIAGVVMVGQGIANRRRRHGLPAWYQTFGAWLSARWGSVARWWARLRKRPQTIEVSSILSGFSSGAARLTVDRRWETLTTEQRVTKLIEIVERLETVTIPELLGQERKERVADLAAEKERREEIEALVSWLATSGLRLEFWGVVALLGGLLLQTIGGVWATV